VKKFVFNVFVYVLELVHIHFFEHEHQYQAPQEQVEEDNNYLEVAVGNMNCQLVDDGNQNQVQEDGNEKLVAVDNMNLVEVNNCLGVEAMYQVHLVEVKYLGRNVLDVLVHHLFLVLEVDVFLELQVLV
jgi:hypothetical protein